MSGTIPPRPAGAPPAAAAPSPAPAATKTETRALKPAAGRAGGYELITELAAGGMATVFLGRSLTADGPLVAVKRPHKHLAADKVFLSMLIDEARLCSAIHHENVVKVRELGFETGEPFVVMDYVEGASLSELRKELAAAERAVDTKVAVKVVLDALAGLHAAHTLHDENGRHLGIIHRDISPHNVLLGVDGRSRLTDFGIAHAVDRVQVTRTHEVKGKLAYLAPERIDKRRMCTVQSDVFSMAVVLWECLAGRRLFRGDEAVDTLQEVMTSHIPRLRLLGAQVPPALDDAIMRGLSRDLSVRYPSAKAFADAIASAAGRTNIGTETDVARVVETVFGPRLGIRHEQVRMVVPADAASRLFAATNITPRPAPPENAVIPEPMLYAAIAPAAPSARYAFGNLNDSLPSPHTIARRDWPLIGAIAGGAAIALVVLGVLVSRIYAHDRAAAANDPAHPPSSTETPAAAATTRHVVVPLPFVSTHVTFDDFERDLDPPSDVASFDVPASSGTRHRLVAVGANGAQAEGTLREVDGAAAPEGGFTTLIAPTASGAETTAAVATATPPVHHSSRPHRRLPSTTRQDGFTKLR